MKVRWQVNICALMSTRPSRAAGMLKLGDEKEAV